MERKVLLAYASKSGSTAEIGEKITEHLRDAGCKVDLMPVNQVADLEPYAVVVLGSAVYFGRWRKTASKFLKAQENALQGKEVWLFSSGPAGEGDPEEMLDGWLFPEELQEIADRIQPRGTAVFHGVMEDGNLNFFERLLLKSMEAPMGDFRDWDLIQAWAEEIAASLD